VSRRAQSTAGAARFAVAVAATIVATAPAAVAFARPAAGVAFEEQRVEFAPGTDNATREGYVDPDNSDRWILRAGAGQVLDLTVDSADDNTVFSVFAPGHNLIANVAQGTTWSGTLPATGDYAVEVASVDDLAYYQLKVWIDAAVRDPLGLVQRMTFAPGTDAGSADGAVVRGSADTWVLGAAAGQTMHVAVVAIEDNATFDVFAPDGLALTAEGDRTVWRGQLAQDGDYHVVVQPTFGNATYTLMVRITGGTASPPTTAAQPPAPATRRITFPPGTDNLTVSDQIGPGETQRWLAGAAAGQTMVVLVTSDSGNVWFQISDPNGATLIPGDNPSTLVLPADGDYTIALSNLGSIADTYVLSVTIG
jgi:hypothetical protein